MPLDRDAQGSAQNSTEGLASAGAVPVRDGSEALKEASASLSSQPLSTQPLSSQPPSGQDVTRWSWAQFAQPELPCLSASGPPARSLDEVQARVHAYITQFKDGYWHPLSNLARLTEEVGELSREINHRHGQKPKRSDERDKSLALEMGDVLFVLATLCNSTGLRLEDCFEAALEKYQLRDAHRYARKEE